MSVVFRPQIQIQNEEEEERKRGQVLCVLMPARTRSSPTTRFTPLAMMKMFFSHRQFWNPSNNNNNTNNKTKKKKKNFKRGTNENTHKQHQPRMGDQKDRDHRGWATMTADAKNKKQTKKSNFHRLF
jgi:hypothetical protein